MTEAGLKAGRLYRNTLRCIVTEAGLKAGRLYRNTHSVL